MLRDGVYGLVGANGAAKTTLIKKEDSDNIGLDNDLSLSMGVGDM